MSSVKDWARWYIARGFAPIEVGFQDKAPKQKKGWSLTTVESAEASLDESFPDGQARNIGIVLGSPSGNLVDIDLDCPEANELAPLFLPNTLVFGRKSTPHSHWLYICPSQSERFRDPLREKATKDKKKPKAKAKDAADDADDHEAAAAATDAEKSMLLEIRSTGGQTVFPPSVHKSGEPIAFVDTNATLLNISPTELQTAVERLAGACLLARYWPPPGARHETQLALAGALLKDGWTEEQAIDLLCVICRMNGNEETAKRISTVTQTAAKIANGEPVTGWKKLEDYFDKTVLRKIRAWMSPQVDTSSASPTISPFTDVANAKRFAVQHGAKVRYVTSWKKWIVWDGVRWNAEIADTMISQLAEETAVSIYEEARVAEAGGRSDFAKELRKHAAASCDVRVLQRMVKWAQVQPGIPIHHNELDRNKWLLTCPNGTLDLQEAVLRPHDPADLITKLCPTLYDPAATCPVWDKVVLEMMGGDQNLFNFLQTAVGYATTACVQEECFILMYGTGNNGKTTFLTTIQDVLGVDHAATVSSDVLLTKPGQSQHPTGLTDLYGKRFVLSVEPDINKSLAEALIKSITGRDRIRARRMNENFWEFAPTHTIFLACNHKPALVGTDEGIKRRIKPVPFTVRFLNPDKQVPSKIAKEHSGVLNYIVTGAQAYLRLPNAFDLPESAQAFKDQYIAEQDRLREFFEDCVETVEGELVEYAVLWKTYTSWCAENGEDGVHRKNFGLMVEERGYPAHRGAQGKRYRKNMRLKGALAALVKALRPTELPVPKTP